MKIRLISILLIAVFPLLLMWGFIFYYHHSTADQFLEKAEEFAEQLTLPFRIARLSAKPADSVLWMPVEGALVKSMANTWGEPRGADRKHEGQDIFAARGTPVYSATDEREVCGPHSAWCLSARLRSDLGSLSEEAEEVVRKRPGE